MSERNNILDISWAALFKVVFALVVLYTVYLIRDILIWFLFALIISILFNPLVDFLQKRKVPRFVAVIVVYFGFFALLVWTVYVMSDMFIQEIQQFSQFFPQYFVKISTTFQDWNFPALESVDTFIGALTNLLRTTTSSIFNILFAIFGGIFAALFIITMAIFLSLEEKAVDRALILFFPKKYENFAISLWARCQKKVSGWFLTRVIGCLFVGIVSYLTFLIFSVDYPVSLAFMAGLTNFVPLVGPLISGALIFVMASLDSLLRGTFVLVAFILIQQIENNVITPVLSKKFIGLSPVLVLIALVIGGKLWGGLGAILAIPVFGIFFEFLRDFLKKKKEEKGDN